MSSVDIEEKRKKIAAAYHSDPWQEKVKRMTDKQVLAVYFRLLNAKRI